MFVDRVRHKIMTSNQAECNALRVEVKEAYADLQYLVCLYKLTPAREIDQMLPVVIQLCLQPPCSIMPEPAWLWLKALVRFIQLYHDV